MPKQVRWPDSTAICNYLSCLQNVPCLFKTKWSNRRAAPSGKILSSKGLLNYKACGYRIVAEFVNKDKSTVSRVIGIAVGKDRLGRFDAYFANIIELEFFYLGLFFDRTHVYYMRKRIELCFDAVYAMLQQKGFAGGKRLLVHPEDKNYDDTAIIIEDAEIMQIPREDFLTMIHSDVNIAAKFIRIITQNVKEKEDRLLSLAYSSLRKRVAKALVDINGKFNTEAGTLNAIEISREEIAQYVGTATESLIRTLSDFKSEKLIDIRNGKIVVSDAQKLKNLLY